MDGFGNRDGKIWLDGDLVNWQDAKVHILSHAMHYASSVFEGERAYCGVVFKSREHAIRLIKSCSLLEMDLSFSLDDIEQAKQDVIQGNSLEDCYLRTIVWRGVGKNMGVSAPQNPIHMAICAWRMGEYFPSKKNGASLDISKWRRPDPLSFPPQAKASALYATATLAKHAAERQEFSGALMMDYRGYIAEATGANIFFAKDGEVHTPIAKTFLNGITRQTVIALLSQQGIHVIERDIRPEELPTFDECWLTGTAAEITPVIQIGHDYFYEPKTMTNTVTDLYSDAVQGPKVERNAMYS
ncbi:branched-chain amino acid aminotransferase [Roseovarius sp. EL26]|uniref:branched-chain amino acid aminotransferase n=1 Tax=Roseovarius sp. EL26 TaxID=2126672 RepID=UPI000EA3F6D6|nr:branched-chain amino acid aminotransferase [Roseovarius sp. EL26]